MYIHILVKLEDLVVQLIKILTLPYFSRFRYMYTGVKISVNRIGGEEP